MLPRFLFVLYYPPRGHHYPLQKSSPTRIFVFSSQITLVPGVLFVLLVYRLLLHAFCLLYGPISTHIVYMYLWSRLRGTEGAETSSPLILEVLRLALPGLEPSTSGKTSFELQIIRVALTLEIIWTSISDRCISGELQQHRSLYF